MQTVFFLGGGPVGGGRGCRIKCRPALSEPGRWARVKCWPALSEPGTSVTGQRSELVGGGRVDRLLTCAARMAGLGERPSPPADTGLLSCRHGRVARGGELTWKAGTGEGGSSTTGDTPVPGVWQNSRGGVFPSRRDGAGIGRGFSPCFARPPLRVPSGTRRLAAYLRHAIVSFFGTGAEAPAYFHSVPTGRSRP